MSFARSNGELCANKVPLAAIAAAAGTPTYVYSWPDMARCYRRTARALGRLDHRICYAVKANANLAVLARFAALGAGWDVVSGGELERVLRAGGDPSRAVFSGVGKSTADIDFALKCGVDCLNVESAGELRRIEARAALLGRRARIAIRVNPDVDAGAHPHIATGGKESKFGVAPAEAAAMYRQAHQAEHLEIVGIACHIGSQIQAPEPYLAALDALLALADSLAGDDNRFRHVDIGGGFGVRYKLGESALDLRALGERVAAAFAARPGPPPTLLVEPGRSLVAAAGVLLTKVEYVKPGATPRQPGFAVVDAAMNDLLRPVLYQAWHRVRTVEPTGKRRHWHVVGPVCESADYLARSRLLALAEGSLLAIDDAGAYGFTQSSNYNGRPRAAEVLVDREAFAIVRRRETAADLWRLERTV